MHTNLARQLGNSPGYQRGQYPGAQDKESADDDEVKILLRSVELLLIALRRDEQEPGYDKEQRDDWKRYHRERLQGSGDERRHRTEVAVKRIVEAGLRARDSRKKYDRQAYDDE